MHNSHDLEVKTKYYNWYFTSFDKRGIFCFFIWIISEFNVPLRWKNNEDVLERLKTWMLPLAMLSGGI
ncbi:MAG: hypothetical protein ACLU4J_23135, partial [Butyricimonas paravirosa]